MECSKKIGEGRSGDIILKKIDKKEYVLKTPWVQINSSNLAVQEKSIENEKEILLSLHSDRIDVKSKFEKGAGDTNLMILREGERHVIKPADVKVDKGQLALEYIDGNSFYYEPCQYDKGTLGKDIVKLTSYLLQAISGLRFVNAKGYVHNDIRENNIMLDSKGRVKLIDFGQAEPKNPIIQGEEWLYVHSRITNWGEKLIKESGLNGECLNSWEHRAASFIKETQLIEYFDDAKQTFMFNEFEKSLKNLIEKEYVSLLVAAVMIKDKNLEGVLTMGFADLDMEKSISSNILSEETLKSALEEAKKNFTNRNNTAHNREIYNRTTKILEAALILRFQAPTHHGSLNIQNINHMYIYTDPQPSKNTIELDLINSLPNDGLENNYKKNLGRDLTLGDERQKKRARGRDLTMP